MPKASKHTASQSETVEGYEGHFEQFEDPYSAVQREKNLKHWPRAWKTALIERNNPRHYHVDLSFLPKLAQ
jgi:predicted GIY-YIG superfamily endonuclease